jgi:ATP-dependent DNA helicase PIF1
MNPLQQAVLEVVKKGNNVFVTGPAGCGKSYVIENIVRYALSNEQRFGVTATSAAAAILIGGRTIHSFLGIGLARKDASSLADVTFRKAKHIVKRLRSLQLLIIDEISMMSDELFDKIDAYLRIIRQQDHPFGGVQLVLSGDFAQLPPVEGDFCFHSRAWESACLEIHYLSINMRQINDLIFQSLLSRAREGMLSPEDHDMLLSLKTTIFPPHIVPTRLYSKRVDVESINKKCIDLLIKKGASVVTFQTQYACEKSKQWANSQRILDKVDICEGAQVVITWNIDVDNNIVNGTRGVVTRIGATHVVVKVVDGSHHIVEMRRHEDEDNKSLWVYYLPVEPAYAVTCHRAQGMTLDAVEIDVGTSIFEYGQAYVALSRARSLNAVKILDVTKKAFRMHPDVKKFYKDYLNQNTSNHRG